MKFRRLFKKAAAALMAAVTVLSVLPATTAFAAGDIGTISFTHTYDSSGNTMRYNSSAVFDGYTAGYFWSLMIYAEFVEISLT